MKNIEYLLMYIATYNNKKTTTEQLMLEASCLIPLKQELLSECLTLHFQSPKSSPSIKEYIKKAREIHYLSQYTRIVWDLEDHVVLTPLPWAGTVPTRTLMYLVHSREFLFLLSISYFCCVLNVQFISNLYFDG